MENKIAKSDLLLKHHIDTLNRLTQHIRSREKFFIWSLILLTVMLMDLLLRNNYAESLINIAINKQYSLNINNPNVLKEAVIWLLAYTSLRYFQINIYIERQYGYLSMVETYLSEMLGLNLKRESQDYLAGYPMFSDWADLVYKIIFPIFFVILLLCYLFQVLHGIFAPPKIKIHIMEITGIIFMLISSVLYTFYINKAKINSICKFFKVCLKCKG